MTEIEWGGLQINWAFFLIGLGVAASLSVTLKRGKRYGIILTLIGGYCVGALFLFLLDLYLPPLTAYVAVLAIFLLSVMLVIGVAGNHDRN